MPITSRFLNLPLGPAMVPAWIFAAKSWIAVSVDEI